MSVREGSRACGVRAKRLSLPGGFAALIGLAGVMCAWLPPAASAPFHDRPPASLQYDEWRSPHALLGELKGVMPDYPLSVSRSDGREYRHTAQAEKAGYAAGTDDKRRTTSTRLDDDTTRPLVTDATADWVPREESLFGILVGAIRASEHANTTVEAATMAKRRLARAARQPDTIPDTRTLAHLFDTAHYRLDKVANGHGSVPRLTLVQLPSDLDRERSIERRKSVFLRTVLPAILEVNEGILSDRRRLEALRPLIEDGYDLGDDGVEWLVELMRRYDVADGDVDALLERVDVIPPSLALAQAATESGWGTSRFAQTGNALFGEWTWDPQQGITPRKRDADANHYVRAFSTLVDSVQSYALNLNTHAAYAEFREARREKRKDRRPIEGHELAGHLQAYASIGKNYVKRLRTIISANGLAHLDDARLQPTSPEPDTTPVPSVPPLVAEEVERPFKVETML